MPGRATLWPRRWPRTPTCAAWCASGRCAQGVLSSAAWPNKEADPQGKYRDYYEYQERLSVIQPHRLLALNRGEHEEALKVRLEAPVEGLLSALERRYVVNRRSIFAEQARMAVRGRLQAADRAARSSASCARRAQRRPARARSASLAPTCAACSCSRRSGAGW